MTTGPKKDRWKKGIEGRMEEGPYDGPKGGMGELEVGEGKGSEWKGREGKGRDGTERNETKRNEATRTEWRERKDQRRRRGKKGGREYQGMNDDCLLFRKVKIW